MKKFLSFIMQLDKQLHFLAGYFIGNVITIVLNSHQVVDPFLYGIGLTGLVGIFKEIYDKQSGTGTPDKYDALTTFVGGIVGSLILFI